MSILTDPTNRWARGRFSWSRDARKRVRHGRMVQLLDSMIEMYTSRAGAVCCERREPLRIVPMSIRLWHPSGGRVPRNGSALYGGCPFVEGTIAMAHEQREGDDECIAIAPTIDAETSRTEGGAA